MKFPVMASRKMVICTDHFATSEGVEAVDQPAGWTGSNRNRLYPINNFSLLILFGDCPRKTVGINHMFMKKSTHSLFCTFTIIALFVCGCSSVPKTSQIVERINQPPPGKALVNFHRPSSFGKPVAYPIFDINGKMLTDMRGASLTQVVLNPGQTTFIGWAEHVSIVQADLAPDKVYDIMVDVAPGWVTANIFLSPMTKNDARRSKLDNFNRREKWTIAINPASPRVAEYEAAQHARVEQIKKDFLNGEKSGRVKVLSKDDCR